jgi:hypothetical protein
VPVIGRTLSSYRVVEKLGAGGMGEVYLARDERLGRDVALKILPDGRLRDEVARSRFRREAQALLRLSHPHVATLFDFGSVDGTDFLVMERVGGKTLDVVLREGPLPERDVVRLGAQLARGLAAAHEAGVIHRDLKPSNLGLTPDGLLKVLDFGVARLVGEMLPAGSGDATATETGAGQVVGSPPYLSPEQLVGKEADARSDVYSAGACLYELATGRRPHGEKTGALLVEAILHEAPPAARSLNPKVSAGLEAVLAKAMDKEPSLRHQTAKDLLADLERLAAGKAPTAASILRERSRGAVVARLWRGLVAVLSLAALAAAAAWLLRSGEPRITSTRTLVRLARRNTGLATDGASVYYAEGVRPTDRLMAVPITGGQPREIPLPWRGLLNLMLFGLRAGPADLLLGRERELWHLPLASGAPIRFEGIDRVGEAAWSSHGDRLAWTEVGDAADALWVSDASGQGRRRLLETPKEEGGGRSVWLVGWHPSDDFLVVSRRGDDCYVEVTVPGGVVRDTPFGCGQDLWGSGAWTPDGAFFVHGGMSGLVAFAGGRASWPWHRRGRADIGGPTHVVWEVFAPDGSHLVGYRYRPAHEVVRLHPATRAVEALLGGAWSGALDFAPDGSRVAWVSTEGTLGRLWVGRPDGSERLPLGDKIAKPEARVAWSPDGRLIAFSAITGLDAVNERLALHLASPADGLVEQLTPEETGAGQIDPCWAPDGRSLVFGPSPIQGFPLDEEVSLRQVDLATRSVTRLAGSEGLWSPTRARDGRILARDHFAQRDHDRKALGRDRVFFKLRDARGERWSALDVELPREPGSPPGDSLAYPTWSPDGRYVYAIRSIPRRTIVRFEPAVGRLESVLDVDHLGPVWAWMAMDPTGAPLVHRDASQREIVVMDFEVR